MRTAADLARIAAALAAVAACVVAAPLEAAPRPCPDCEVPYEWDDGASGPPPLLPYPQGFALTVPIGPAQRAPRIATLDRYAEVSTALGTCLSSALRLDGTGWSDLTVRLSFKRDGAINGVPRIVHFTGPADQQDARGAMLSALAGCTPLPFSPSLGRAIAGQIFAIRFVKQRNI